MQINEKYGNPAFSSSGAPSSKKQRAWKEAFVSLKSTQRIWQSFWFCAKIQGYRGSPWSSHGA